MKIIYEKEEDVKHTILVMLLGILGCGAVDYKKLTSGDNKELLSQGMELGNNILNTINDKKDNSAQQETNCSPEDTIAKLIDSNKTNITDEGRLNSHLSKLILECTISKKCSINRLVEYILIDLKNSITWDVKTLSYINSQTILPGMSPLQVMLILGFPDKMTETVTKDNKTMRWQYGNTQLTFTNNLLEIISK